MHDTTALLPLLEAAKAALISTPWMKKCTEAARTPQQQQQQQQQQRERKRTSRTPTESTSAAVLCELLELRHLHTLLRTAIERHARQPQPAVKEKKRRKGAAAAAAAAPLQGSSHGDSEQAHESRETEIMRCTLQHYYAVLRGCDANVCSLCSVYNAWTHQQDIRVRAPPSTPPISPITDVDVVDVLFVLVLCIAATLCWQQKQREQALLPRESSGHHPAVTRHSTGTDHTAGVVSSSRDASEYSQRSSRVTSAHHSDAAGVSYSFIREHYGLYEEVSKSAAAGGRGGTGLQRALQSVLPLLEVELPVAELWREPSLLAALDVMACGVWQAQAVVHAAVPSNANNQDRCPLCYAAALNNDLAVEAMVQLNSYYVTYHGDGKVTNRGPHEGFVATQQHREEVKRALLVRGWVAASRIALWNDNVAVFARLTAAPSLPPWLPHSAASCATPCRSSEAVCVLSLLWSHWWRAEMCLASSQAAAAAAIVVGDEERAGGRTTSPSASSSSLNALTARSPAQRLRCCQLFRAALLSSLVAAHESGNDEQRQKKQDVAITTALQCQRETVWSWLLRLPLTFPSAADDTADAAVATTSELSAGSTAVSQKTTAPYTTGTVLHWLCACDDVVLLRLCLLPCTQEDWPHLRSPPPHPHAGQAHTLPPAAGECHVEMDVCGSHFSGSPLMSSTALPHIPHVVELTGPPSSSYNADHIDAASAAVISLRSAAVSQRTHPPHPATSARFSISAGALLDVVRLHDTRGRSTLEVACQHGHLHCVRLLLQAGASPNSLAVDTWRTFAAALPLPLLRLLYDPSVLNGADSSASHASLAERLRSTHCPAAAARTLAQLAYRLWTEKVQYMKCPSVVADSATSKMQDGAPPSSIEEQQQHHRQRMSDVPCADAVSDFAAWCKAYAQCQTAQDRVLRPALAALAYDAHEPLARLVMLAVLTRKLSTWLTTVSPHIRNGDSTGNITVSHRSSDNGASCRVSLRELRLQHTVALRLYTQLTCPLGRGLLRAAVEARSAICAAVELREEKAAALLLASAQAATLSAASPPSPQQQQRPAPTSNADTPADRADPSAAETAREATEGSVFADAVKPAERSANIRGASQQQQQQSTQLPLSEAAKARRELQALYASVMAEVQHLNECLVAEQQRVTEEGVDASQGHNNSGGGGLQAATDDERTLSCTATVLRGRRVNSRRGDQDAARTLGTEGESLDDTPSYVLVVIPSALALQHARWNAQSRATTTTGAIKAPLPRSCSSVVEPTLWCAAHTPRQVWVQLPRHLHLNSLLRTHDGGGYGVVSQDMPLTAPVQRGDLITFRHTRRTSWSTLAVPQFVAQAIFSEGRTLPYITVSAGHPTAMLPYVAPPASVVLPFTAVPPSVNSSGGAATVAATSSSQQLLRQLRGATTITLHACCIPSLYLDGLPKPHRGDAQHPLDWLQARPTAMPDAVSRERNRHTCDSCDDYTDVDVLAVLRTRQDFVSRWSHLMWGGVQPCWLAASSSATDAMKDSGTHLGIGNGTGCGSSFCDGRAFSVVNLFGTDEQATANLDDEDNDDDISSNFVKGVTAEKLLLTVRQAPTCCGERAVQWASRADAAGGTAGADVVVDVAVAP